jgi:hypothetical protein
MLPLLAGASGTVWAFVFVFMFAKKLYVSLAKQTL